MIMDSYWKNLSNPASPILLKIKQQLSPFKSINKYILDQFEILKGSAVPCAELQFLTWSEPPLLSHLVLSSSSRKLLCLSSVSVMSRLSHSSFRFSCPSSRRCCKWRCFLGCSPVNSMQTFRFVTSLQWDSSVDFGTSLRSFSGQSSKKEKCYELSFLHSFNRAAQQTSALFKAVPYPTKQLCPY